MSKTLIIAEKPSVATDISKALGGFTKHDDYFESDAYVLSSAVGHLLEIGMPEEEEVKRGKWTFAHLPAVPSKFALKPIEKNENRLKTLLRLIKRKDVGALINACDAGREGELIFRYIAQFAKSTKPIKRLWLQSMTTAAIRDGFAKLRSDEAMLPLADAAVCRSEADWLVGINGTRAMTAFNSKSGGFQLTTVGRVQTPTLAILVDREAKIRAFRPRDYWEAVGTFRAAAGEYTGKWFDEKFRKSDEDPDARADRMWEEARARAIAAACTGKPGTVTDESKPTTQSPPLLYDLTSLQREANGRFGFSARTTLSLAQALYEKHKVLTYPRTDARALPEDYIGTVNATLDELAESNAFGGFAREIIKRKWVRPNKRIFDNSKISDHFAIIPTLVRPKALNEIEGKLYDLVVRRFLAVFYPAAEHFVTTRITRVAEEPFKTEGRILVNPGWLAVYGKEAQGDESSLVAVKPGETVATEKVDVVQQVTKPPPRLNEATLLSAMEGAGKLIEDDELREAMREKGLGTPATRAAIIEGLIAERYVYREGKELVPTAKAFSLLTLLHGLGVPELFSPELTAEWEFKLAQMEHGKLPRDTFMREIVAMTEHIVGQAKNYESDTIPGDFATLTTPCPKCGGEVHEKYKKFQCIKCDFAFWKIMGGRQMEPQEAEVLLKEREIGPLEGFRSKMGRPFSAKLKLTDTNEVTFDFGNPIDDDGPPPDFSAQTPLGTCPKCGNRVFEHGMSYVCEKAAGADRTCDFRSGRIILQRAIESTQMTKLLAERKTDLLQFVSQRTRRPFSAFLVVQKDGKVGFEFEAKDPTKARGARARPATALRVLGNHPKDRAPVELHSGRYGPYVKHGTVNATLPDSEKADSLTLDEALELLAAKTGKSGTGTRARATKAAVKKTIQAPTATKTAAPLATGVAAGAAAKPAARTAAKTAAKISAKTAVKSAAKTAAKPAAESTPKNAAKTAAKPAAKAPAKTAARKIAAKKTAAKRRTA
ncbi:MAG: DNA topoisomerase III [Casimicrobiaceae bacterium]